MARILVTSEGSWYDELKAVAYYGESEFESFIHQQLKNIFPDYYAISFKKDVISKLDKTKRPDLALIRKDFKEWWIVEAEMSEHELEHVTDQVTTFANGQYNSIEYSKYIFKQFKKWHRREAISEKKIRRLLNAKPPLILVIVDAQKSDWVAELKKLDVRLCLFESYRNMHGNHSYRLEGDYPVVKESQSLCRYVKSLPNTMQVLRPAVLERYKGKEIEIVYQGRLTRWLIDTDKSRLFLSFHGSINHLPSDHVYSLSRDSRGKFYMEMK